MDISKRFRFEEANAHVEVVQSENQTPSVWIEDDRISRVLVANHDINNNEVIIFEGEEFEVQVRGRNVFVPLVEALDQNGLLDTAIQDAIRKKLAAELQEDEAYAEAQKAYKKLEAPKSEGE